MTGPTLQRLRLILSQLRDQIQMQHAPGTTYPYPKLRNFVLDVLAEGRRKPTIHVLFEADVDGIKEQLAELRARGGEPVSMTSYIAKSFACAIAEDRRLQAYRLGKSRLVVFDDVDIAFIIEREWEGELCPVFFIVRAAQRKTVYEIHRELRAAREAPLGVDGPMSALELQFFLLPGFLRKALWYFIRKNPYWFKDLAGTVGFSSVGMYTSGAANGIPITPMTITLSIGTTEKKLVLRNGEPVERDVVHLNFSFDHSIVDGAPVMRLADRLKRIMLDREILLSPAASGTGGTVASA